VGDDCRNREGWLSAVVFHSLPVMLREQANARGTAVRPSPPSDPRHADAGGDVLTSSYPAAHAFVTGTRSPTGAVGETWTAAPARKASLRSSDR